MVHTRKDMVATALVAAVVVIYVGYLFGDLPFVQDVKEMAAVGLVLSFASRRIGGRHGFRHERAAMAANLGSLALGFSALATGSSVLLALFMASVVGLWLAAVYVSMHGYPPTRVHAQLRGHGEVRR